MDETLVGIMEIVGPAILLVVLLWLVMRRRSDRSSGNTTETGTRNVYAEEEARRREGTDDL